jgi:hypothetical protein
MDENQLEMILEVESTDIIRRFFTESPWRTSSSEGLEYIWFNKKKEYWIMAMITQQLAIKTKDKSK